MGIRFAIPNRFLNPHGFLGFLTFVVFVILGITGALLMFYYQPTLEAAYDSVAAINDDISFGIIIRNIHYHASNAMVFLAIYHMFYQFFSGRYKIRNEILWVTGVILGTLTVLEAYTGYDLIMNERAVLAISIGVSLTNSVPVVGPNLAALLMGSGFADIVLRFYTLHVFVLPLIMALLMLLHFPRNLIFDIPMISYVAGGILIVAGVFPISLGTKFNPDIPPGITVPEWYLTGIYALIRTYLDKFVAGVLIPTIFIIVYLLAPFYDRGRAMAWYQRPLASGLGIAGLGQIAVTTVWGFYVNPDPTLSLQDRLFVDPVPFYTIMFLILAASFALTYGYNRKMKGKRPQRYTGPEYRVEVGSRTITALVIVLIVVQLAIIGLAFQAYLAGQWGLAMIELGSTMIAFGVLVHVVRYSLAKRGEE